MIGTSQPKVLAKFYEEVLEKKPDMEQDGWYGFQAGSSFISIGEHSEAKDSSKEPFSIMFNFETAELQKDFDRLKEIENIEVIKEPYDAGDGMMIATLADPDGNYFQLMPPWEEEK